MKLEIQPITGKNRFVGYLDDDNQTKIMYSINWDIITDIQQFLSSNGIRYVLNEENYQYFYPSNKPRKCIFLLTNIKKHSDFSISFEKIFLSKIRLELFKLSKQTKYTPILCITKTDYNLLSDDFKLYFEYHSMVPLYHLIMEKQLTINL